MNRVYAKYPTAAIAAIATIVTIRIGTRLLCDGGRTSGAGSSAIGAAGDAGAGTGSCTAGAGAGAGAADAIGAGAENAVGGLYSFSIVSPFTATSWNVGAPPPLRIIASISERIVRIFTSDGGGGGAVVINFLGSIGLF